jgi:hypothetical protein
MRLAGLEIDWLCKYANVAEKTEDILTEQHDQALGEVLRLQQTIAEQKARIEELEFDASMARLFESKLP